MRSHLVLLKIDSVTAVLCLASVAVSVGSMFVLYVTGGLETRCIMAIVSIPYIVGTIALSLSCSVRMRPGWGSFLVSSGVGRKEMIRLFHAPALAVYLTVSISFATAYLLLPEETGIAILSCACVALAVSVLTSVVGILSYSISGSSLMTGLSGVVVPMVLAMISYLSFVKDSNTDPITALACLVVTAVIAVVCLKASMDCFRRLDL